MRLDHFLPLRPRPVPGRPAPRRARRLLARLGPSWASAPLRRTIQGLAFLAFLALFFWVCWPYGGRDHAATREAREVVDAELFLALDPLVGISTALAARAWVWSLGFGAAMLVAGLLVPRGFCGYLCPLGTLIDVFDAVLGRRVTRFRVKGRGGWVHLKYYILAGTLVASATGVLVSGFVAAIPVLTRGLLFLAEPLVIGGLRGAYQVPPMNLGHAVSLALFLGVLGLGLLGPRFWCRHVCPTGAVFSAVSALRLSQRRVRADCVDCGRCVEACPFDAIKPDFTTRTADCTLCQTCGGACPVGAIHFVGRWEGTGSKEPEPRAPAERPLSRRGFLAAGLGGAAASLLAGDALGARAASAGGRVPIRPPGSVPEPLFLDLCIRCGACVKACPNNCLHAMGFGGQGLEGLWTPHAVPRWSGCEPSCNNCGHVCPTGAIRALPMEEKRATRMGLAVVDEAACLPLAGVEACRMCVDECQAAGYAAIEVVRIRAVVDAEGRPEEGSGFQAPVVVADRCVGCGICETRCHAINVGARGVLARSAIEVLAGEGREDRLTHGSVLSLREERRLREQQAAPGTDAEYLPDFLNDR